MRGIETAADTAPECHVDISMAVRMTRMAAIANVLGAETIEGLRVRWVKGAAIFDAFHRYGSVRSETGGFVDRYFGLNGGDGEVEAEHVV